MSAPPSSPRAETDLRLALAESASFIRAVEQCLLDLFRQNRVSGTVHACIGQEFCAACLHPHLQPARDLFVGSHRAHGHVLAAGVPAERLLAEIMGREGALCGGRGGSQHLHSGHVYTSGIQGGGSLWATGMAWAQSLAGAGGITVVQLGDGTLGEGALYEAFAFAAWLRLPVLFYLEWNGWAQSTDTATTTPGDVLDRARAFGLAAARASDEDPVALHGVLKDVVAQVRSGRPTLQVVDTRRLAAHSKGDDHRPPALRAELAARDPLNGLFAEVPALAQHHATATASLAALADTISARAPSTPRTDGALAYTAEVVTSDLLTGPCGETTARALNAALAAHLAREPRALLVGQDLADPYGGAFKVSSGLSTRFPGRVISTPIAEAGIVGLCSGLALRGWRPVAEIMFADFATLAADQLVNHAAKFRFMFGGQSSCPLVVRLPSGAGHGYGPTHSQCLETLFLGVPGLRVVALSARHHPGRLLETVLRRAVDPVLLVEPKRLYGQRPATAPLLDLALAPSSASGGDLPSLWFRAPAPRVTVVTYGAALEAVEAALVSLFVDDEIDCDLVVLTQLWPLVLEEVRASVARSGRVLVVEEGPSGYGVGAAVLAGLANGPGRQPLRARTLGAAATPIPAARHLEAAVLPQAVEIVRAVRAFL